MAEYLFERHDVVGKRRRLRDARRDLQTLLVRMQVMDAPPEEDERPDEEAPPAETPEEAARQKAKEAAQEKEAEQALLRALTGDRECYDLLLRFCVDVPLNIAWYEREIDKDMVRNRAAIGVTAALAVALLTAMAHYGLGEARAGVQIMLVATYGFGLLRILSTLFNWKTRIESFRKASADLKEILFTLEQTWTAKVFIGEPRAVHADFRLAVRQALRSARRVAQEERARYFATLISPKDVIDVANSAIQELAGRRKELVQVEREGAERHHGDMDRRIADLRARIASAEATMTSTKKRLEEIGAAGAPDQKHDLEVMLGDARFDRMRARALLERLLQEEAFGVAPDDRGGA